MDTGKEQVCQAALKADSFQGASCMAFEAEGCAYSAPVQFGCPFCTTDLITCLAPDPELDRDGTR